jgi:UDP-N-acetylglucosamine 2-epimerase (non-hydrolysing)/GDP/UDP-N,N'-diacetylbacillosamine 2-epimerase (hydrolysing)
MTRKVCVVTGSRAEYGLIAPVLKAIKDHPRLDLVLIACGMHLSEEFGDTYEDIEKDGLRIDARINNISGHDTGAGMAGSVGVLISEMTMIMEKIKPDFIIALTDLGHALGSAVIGVYMNIPVAHIHGGDVSGTADEPIRHAITKLSHIHFAATKESANRIIKMGEEPWRVHVSGAPGLDSILNQEPVGDDELIMKRNSF